MSKFCAHCGKPLHEGAKFCAGCGCAVPEAAVPQPEQVPVQVPVVQPPVEQPAPVAPAPKKKKTGLIVGVLLAVVALIVAAVLIPWGDLFGGSSTKDEGASASSSDPAGAMNLYYDVLYEVKADRIKDLAPQAYWDWIDDEYGIDLADVIDYFEDEVQEDVRDDLQDEYGNNYRVAFTKKSQENVDSEELEMIAEALDDFYDINEKYVTKAVRISGEVVIKGSEDDDDNEVEDAYVIQIDGKWYYVNVSFYDEGVSVRFPVDGLTSAVANERGSDDDQEDLEPPAQNQNTPSQNEQATQSRDIDPVMILQNIWDDYLTDHTMFYTVGGDPENRVDDAPALHDTVYYRENLTGTYKVREDWIYAIDKVATLTDGNIANDFCSAVYVLSPELSDFDVEDFMTDIGQGLKDADWEGYAPDRILVGLVDDGCVLVAFGTNERILAFRDSAMETYGLQLWYDTFID